MKYHILFNPLSANGQGTINGERAKALLADQDCDLIDITLVKDYEKFFSKLDPSDVVVLCGGDGTLNRFANSIYGLEIQNRIDYYAGGTGNDFLHDIGGTPDTIIKDLGSYIKRLPSVTVNGQKTRFINGIGYGIDGYCCEEGDKEKEHSTKPVNYAAIAIKGLLFFFKPANSEICVDGKQYSYRKVWLAPTMFGRFYGGGMIPTPAQDRNNTDGTVSVCVWHGSGKIKTLSIFPSIFKGEHVKHTDVIEILTGHNVTVKFDRPCALQIDGETVLNVTQYSVEA